MINQKISQPRPQNKLKVISARPDIDNGARIKSSLVQKYSKIKELIYSKNLNKSIAEYEKTKKLFPVIEGASNYSGAGGYNPAYNRIKISTTEELSKLLSSDDIFSDCVLDYNLSNEDKESLRVCFRVVLNKDDIEKYRNEAYKKGFVFEYIYPDGENDKYVLGMGINGKERYDNKEVIIDQTEIEIDGNHYNRFETNLCPTTKNKFDRQNEKGVRQIPSPESLMLSTANSIKSLNEMQKYQLATGLIEYFGSSWSLEKVIEIDNDPNLQPLTLIDLEGNVVGFTIAEKYGNCVELTEMFISENYHGKGYSKLLIPELLKICRPKWKNVTYFGEFNLSSESWRSALDAGGKIVGFIPSNVTVNSENAENIVGVKPKSFVVMIFDVGYILNAN